MRVWAYQLAPRAAEIADTLGWLLNTKGYKAAATPRLDQAWKAAPDNPDNRLPLCLGPLQGWKD